jgi:hypothetical protein
VNAVQVALSAPANGAQFAAHAEIVLIATTTERVAKVEFYDGTVRLGAGIAEGRFSYRLALSDGLAAGAHALRVRATDAHALIVWSAETVITVARSPLTRPSIELSEPVAGTIYPTGSSLALRARVTGSADRVSRVEFYDEQELIATVTTPAPDDPTAGSINYVVSAWSVDTPGLHQLRARIHLEDAEAFDSPPVSIRVVPTLPYVASFESREKYRLGSLHGQLGWKVVRGSAAIFEVGAFDGAQAVELSGGLTGGRVDQLFGPPVLPRPIFVDLAVRPVAGSIPAEGTMLDFGGARLAFVAEGSAGRFALPQDGRRRSAAWTPVGEVVAIDPGPEKLSAPWTRLTMRLDFQAPTWDLFVDGRLAGFDLALEGKETAPAGFRRLSIRSGPGTTSAFDFLFVGYENPLFADNDQDGMEDAWERMNGLDPARNDRTGDHDADGLSNLEEYYRGTRADLADTDADGLPDGWEIRHHLDPLRPAGESSDADLDGLDDVREFLAGTDPTNPDSDGDGVPDGWEVVHGLDPLQADSAGDPDGDGLSSLEEYRRGTDPTDFFDGLSPQVLALNEGEAGADNELALIARRPDGTPWANAPVTFRITSGSRRLAVNAGGGPYLDVIGLRADANGLARVYLEPLAP